MKDPRSYIERFCYKHPHFGIPNLMKYVAIANVVFWVLGAVNPVLLSYLSFDAALVLRGQIWRVVTFALYPPSTGLLAFVAFYFYYWIGSTLEQYWGTPQFNIYFFTGLILTLLYGFLVYLIGGVRIVLNAQYVYLSMFFSFAVLFPDMQVLLFFFIPIKIKWLALIDAAYFLLEVFSARFPVNLLPVVAVLNFLIFCGGDLLRMRPRRPAAGTVNFRREAQRIRREQGQQLYNHKCAVCGRTDKTDPQLEFRYCSRCAGYHCFCQDHINNHIHFKE
ncbi:MAG: hypothetical protein IJ594_07130 [Oscillospiraceae bacterium]|nr:hypothetical protein [Oscillospiraceae bacterium]